MSGRRFTAKDPIGYFGGINLFGYVGNNPLNWVDPLGLLSEEGRRAAIDNWTAYGSAIGATIGFFGGGGSGFFTGPAAGAAVPAGAYYGAIGGGIAGAAVGRAAAIGVLGLRDALDAISFSRGAGSSGDCSTGGLREGKPDVPEGSRMRGDPVRARVTSAEFKQFLKQAGLPRKGWKYVMEKWITPTGRIVPRHYWLHKSGRAFYHLR